MPGAGAEYARLPVTELADLSSEEEDDLYTRPPRPHRPRSGPARQPAPTAFREAATRPVKRYQLLDEEDALGALQATPDIRQPGPLTATRRACLVTACLLTLIGVSVAVWLVPCQWYGCTKPPSDLQQSSVHRDYEVMFPGIVVTSRLVVAPAVYRDSADLVLGFRRQDSASGGLMVVASGSGDELWHQELYEAPVDVQCGGVDLDGDGVFECLVTGSSRLMALVNMDKRRVEWYLHGHNSSWAAESLLPPLLLADLTGDGAADLLVAGLSRPASHSRPPASQLSLVDGATGSLLSQGAIADCPVLLRLSAADDVTGNPADDVTGDRSSGAVTLECMAPQTGVVSRTESLAALTGPLRTADMKREVRLLSSRQQGGSGGGRSGFQVQLENSGACPRCGGRLTLLDDSGAAVWSTSPERSRLHSVQQFSHRNHSGFIYKLWQYPAGKEWRRPETLRRVRRWWPSGEDLEGTPVPTLTFEESAFVTQSSDGIHFRYQHPEAAGAVAAEPGDGSVPEFVTESVHVVWPGEAGQLETRQLDSVLVTRFCRGPQLQRCQPQTLPDNTPTAAVVDVGGDGDLDLVSVTSLFVPEGEVVVPRHRHQCSLQTRLRKRQLYGPHWRETLSPDTLPGAGPEITETMSEVVPTEETPLP